MKIAVLAAALMASAPVARASAPAVASKAPDFSFGDWQITTAGEVDLNYQSGDFTVPNHLTLTRPGSDISANRAKGNQRSKQATLTGNVVLHDRSGALSGAAGAVAGASTDPATLTCNELQVDGVSKIYTATGDVHFQQGSRRVSADRAVMNGLTHEIRLLGRVHMSQ